MEWFQLWLIPELSRLLNDDDRHPVFHHATGRGWYQWWLSACILLSWPCSNLTYSDFFRDLFPSRLLYYGSVFLVPLVVMLGMMPLGFVVLRPHLRRKARRHMSDRYGCPICVPCGYDLTGNESGVCPECGTAVPKWTAFGAKRNIEIDRTTQDYSSPPSQ